MRRWAMVCGGLGLCLALAGPAGATPRPARPSTIPNPYGDTHTGLPVDVQRFAVRRDGCMHWGGEEGYDAARRRQIIRETTRLRCDALDGDAARLRNRHAADPASLAALTTPE